MTRLSIGLVLGLLVCGFGRYGPGSGWLRLGPPGQDRAHEARRPPDRRNIAHEDARPQFLPIAPIDLQVLRAQTETPPAAPAPAAPPPATASTAAPSHAAPS